MAVDLAELETIRAEAEEGERRFEKDLANRKQHLKREWTQDGEGQ